MAAKKYDIAVKTGEYTNQQGETKGRYQNVGAVIQGDNGPYIIMERWFNPAGISNPDGRSSVILSLFEPRQHDGQGQQPQQNQAPQQRQQAPHGQPQQGGYVQPPAYQQGQQGKTDAQPPQGGIDVGEDIPFAPYMRMMAV